MIVETNNIVDSETANSLAVGAMGGVWLEFCRLIPIEQARVLTEGCNIILLSDEETELPVKIIETIIREDIDIPAKKLLVYELTIVRLLEILETMGVEFEEELVEFEDLELITKVLDVFYEIQEYEDLIGIRNILDNTELSAEAKLLETARVLYPELDFDVLEDSLTEVSLMVINTLRYGIKEDDKDETTLIPKEIVDRLKKNVDLFKDSVIYEHIVNDGQLGSKPEDYFNFFRNELEHSVNNDTEVNYFKLIIGIYLMSDVKSSDLKEQLILKANELLDDYKSIVLVEQLIGGINLEDNN